MKNNNFVIITTIYNGEKWLTENIRSVLSQTYQNYVHVIVDDASTDKTSDSALRFQKEFPNRLTVIQKVKRQGCLHSHLIPFLTFPSIRDNDIIVHLDGDDYLKDPNVLEHLNKVYQETSCKATYGDYEVIGFGGHMKSVCSPFRVSSTIRENACRGWGFSHLRTFRKYLMDKIPYNYILNKQGELFEFAPDVALFLPILELAGADNIQYIEKILMVYRRHSKNEDIVNLEAQGRCATEILMKRPLQSLKNENSLLS